jgi:starch synthase (maltosyl-transferring)
LKKEFNDIVFLAETLGCTPVQIKSISNCGFDYIFNSSKWWNYNDSWCLEQYSLTRTIAPSISFPETHDTSRLMDEVKGDEVTFLQRIYFEAVFSKGFMITSGMEYGFKKKINVVETRPEDWEKTGHDYRSNIKSILAVKQQLKPLHEESVIEIIDQQNWMNVFCFVKEYDGVRVLLILNKNTTAPERIVLNNLEAILRTDKILDVSPDTRKKGTLKQLDLLLKPGELKIFASEKNIG